MRPYFPSFLFNPSLRVVVFVGRTIKDAQLLGVGDGDFRLYQTLPNALDWEKFTQPSTLWNICHRDTNLSFVTKGLPLSKISRDIVMAERDVIYRAMSAVAHSSKSEGNKTSFQPILLSGGINCNNPAANLLLT